MAKNWKKRLFLSKNDLSWAKNQKSFRSMAIFLLLWFVVFNIEGFEHQSVHWRPQIYGSHWPKTKKFPINTPEYHFHMVCSHFFGKFWALYVQQIWDLLEASFYFILGSGFQFLCQNNVWHLEASQVQIGRSHLGIPSFMSKYRFFRVSISFLKSKIIDGIWRPLKVYPGGQQDTDRQVSHCNMLSCMP